MDYFNNLPDDLIMKIHSINEAKDFRNNLITHKQRFNGILNYVNTRCRSVVGYNEDGEPEGDYGLCWNKACMGGSNFTTNICLDCIEDDDDIMDQLGNELQTMDTPYSYGHKRVYNLLQIGIAGKTRCGCSWDYGVGVCDKLMKYYNNAREVCGLCADLGDPPKEPNELKKYKFEIYEYIIIFAMNNPSPDTEIDDDEPWFCDCDDCDDKYREKYRHIKHDELGGLTIYEYIMRFANGGLGLKDERFVGWEDERLEEYLE